MHTLPSASTVEECSNKDNHKCNVLFGCHICEVNLITGGRSGYSCGNVSVALKSPPSLQNREGLCVLTTCVMNYGVSGGP